MSEILIVDDSAMLRLLVSYTLSGADGFRVREASGAPEALEALEEGTFSMMLTDFHMPGTDGVGLVQAVRAMPEHSHMPIIMMTSDTDPVVQREATAAGVDAFIIKPFEPRELHSTVRRMLEQTLAAEDAESPHRFGSAELLEAFPYPAMVLDEEHNIVMGNAAFYSLTGAGISDTPPKCSVLMHGEHGRPPQCPLVEAVKAGGPAEAVFDDPVRGKMQISVYPMDAMHVANRRLYLHLARTIEG